jgi:hypothetical protein
MGCAPASCSLFVPRHAEYCHDAAPSRPCQTPAEQNTPVLPEGSFFTQPFLPLFAPLPCLLPTVPEPSITLACVLCPGVTQLQYRSCARVASVAPRAASARAAIVSPRNVQRAFLQIPYAASPSCLPALPTPFCTVERCLRRFSILSALAEMYL